MLVNTANGTEVPVDIKLPHDPNIQRLEQLANPKDGRIDYAKAKVAIDHMIDRTIDEAATLAELDRWAAIARSRTPPGAGPLQTMNAIGTTLAIPGPWNDNRPFSYDLTDPLGAKPGNKLISTYLKTRKGNCVSMPTLLVILGQKLGLNMSLSFAPSHLFAKIQNSDGRWINIEATSNESPSDAKYISYLHLPEQSIKSGIYLRTLTPRETVGAMLDPLLSDYAHTKSPEYMLGLANFAYKLDPKDVNALIGRANAYFLLLRERYLIHHLIPDVLPPDQRIDFIALYNTNVSLFKEAEAMGWHEPTKEDKQEYLQRVAERKEQHGG